MRTYIFFFLFAYLSGNPLVLMAQRVDAVQLERQYQNSPTSSRAVSLSNAYQEQAFWYQSLPQYNQDSTMLYFEKSIVLLEQTKPAQYQHLAKAYYNLSEYNKQTVNNFIKADSLSAKAWANFEQIPAFSPKKNLQYDILLNWALIKMERGETSKGFDMSVSAFNSIQSDVRPEMQAKLLKGKADFYGLYNRIDDYTSQSFQYLNESAKRYEQLDVPERNEALCDIYLSLAWHYNVHEKADSTDFYFRKAENLLPSLKNPKINASFWIQKGNNLSRRNRNNEARKLIIAGLDIAKTYKMEYSKLYQFGLGILGAMAKSEGKYDEAIGFVKAAQRVAAQRKIPNALIDCLGQLSELYVLKGQNGVALDYYRQYSDERIAFLKANSEKGVRENELQLNVLQKEKELVRKRDQQTIFGATLFIFALLIGLLYRNYRFKQQSNQKLGLLNEELETKNVLLDKRNAENELLLKEIHHRVKNNLEIVSSLLELQSAQIDNPSVQAAMLSSQNRVHSMGIIHQKLYQGEHLAAIEMRDYFIHLGENIVSSFNEKGRIKVECNMPKLVLDVDTAISIGLITNELITNALKYAFIEKEKGEINISINESDTSGGMLLKISDNGIGKTMNESAKGTGFGTQLILLLTRQLNGELSYEVNNGTTVCLYFRKTKSKQWIQ